MLPIDNIRLELSEALRQGSVVITAPTGTGKSTQVPRWLPGRTLVVEPRRVACRSVAARLAELEGASLGEAVGYRVRDDDRSSSATRLLVVTPGIVLSTPRLLDEFDYFVLDEIHERRLDTDLILALLVDRRAQLIAMSATIEGERIAQYVGGQHLSVQARTYPVEISYQDSGDQAPSSRDLPSRVRRAVLESFPLDGNILVFAPGKGEIATICAALSDVDAEVVALHGSLSLEQQARILSMDRQTTEQQKARPRIVVTTNVAETSLTVPGVRMVIDSGLVRRTSYHEGRSYLGLSSVATDSADQRAGRAGRTSAGTCIRLWGKSARLEPKTPPEMHRESLSPLLLSLASLNRKPEELAFLDPPPRYAIDDARHQLERLGALDTSGNLTETGRQLQRLPLDPWLSRVLVEAKASGCLTTAIDLVAALEQPQAHLLSPAVPDEALSRLDCDLEAIVTAVRQPHLLTGPAQQVAEQARLSRKRLRQAFHMSPPSHAPLERQELLRAIVRADARAAHVARRRKSRLRFSSGGTEIELDRNSRAHRITEMTDAAHKSRQLEAIVALATRAIVKGPRERLIIATAASPVSHNWLADARLGEEHVAQAKFSNETLFVEVERVLAGQTISVRKEIPEGELARTAIMKLFLEGRLYPEQKKEAQRRLSRRALAARLGKNPEFGHFRDCEPPPSLADFLKDHLQELGVESGSDLALLSPEDFLPPDVPAELSPTLTEKFPLQVDVGDCLYEAEYDLDKRQVLLNMVRGKRAAPPPPSYLPRFEGLKVFAEAGGSFHLIRRG